MTASRRCSEMPALKNHRQERFCQLVKQGIPPYRAYPMAGYEPDDGALYRLSGNVRVKRRIAELTRSLAVKTAVTIASLTEQIVEDREFARAHDNPSAAHAATVTLGKLHGHLIERKEIGQPGDFAGLSTAEVKARIAADFGSAAAEMLEALLQASEARGEAIESEVSIDKPKVDESERAVELFHGKRR